MIARSALVVLGLTVLVAGCSSPLTTREKGALAGGAVGAGAGAAVGSASGHAGTGALIGAGVGVVTGAVIGDSMQNAERKAASPPPPPQAAPPPPGPGPRMLWVPEWGMYVVEGQDVVFYNGAYYHVAGGRWYISSAYTGPWAIVATPPPMIAKLPRGHLHRNLPPGLAKKGKVPPGHAKGKVPPGHAR